jgi:hypothetical protein
METPEDVAQAVVWMVARHVVCGSDSATWSDAMRHHPHCPEVVRTESLPLCSAVSPVTADNDSNPLGLQLDKQPRHIAGEN